jgi:DNA replication protein DnaC
VGRRWARPDLPLARLQDHGGQLTRFTLQTRRETRRQAARGQELTSADCRDRRLAEALAAQSDTDVALRTVMARFPSRKPRESCDWSLQPALERKKVQELATCRFLEHGDHAVFLGPPGTGKTHWAMALGRQAVQPGDRTAFTAALPLLDALTKAYAENRLEERLTQSWLPTRLILDAIGDMPIDRHGAHLFLPLIARRYERGAIRLTSHPRVGHWAEVFGEPIIATAVLDRRLHHSHVLHIQGDSSRLTEQQQAGLLNRRLTPEAVSPRGWVIFQLSKGALFQ